MSRLTPHKRKVFGALLRSEREKRGWSVRKVAEIISYSFSSLAAMERGEEVKLKMSVIENLCILYELPLDDICISIEKIPTHIFYKIIDAPELINIIRNYEV